MLKENVWEKYKTGSRGSPLFDLRAGRTAPPPSRLRAGSARAVDYLLPFDELRDDDEFEAD